MVTIFRRHSKTCPGYGSGPGKGRDYPFDKCDCTIWADPRPIASLQSLKTKSRAEALRLANAIELNGGAIPEKKADPAQITIEQAGTEFLASL